MEGCFSNHRKQNCFCPIILPRQVNLHILTTSILHYFSTHLFYVRLRGSLSFPLLPNHWLNLQFPTHVVSSACKEAKNQPGSPIYSYQPYNEVDFSAWVSTGLCANFQWPQRPKQQAPMTSCQGQPRRFSLVTNCWCVLLPSVEGYRYLQIFCSLSKISWLLL